MFLMFYEQIITGEVICNFNCSCSGVEVQCSMKLKHSNQLQVHYKFPYKLRYFPLTKTYSTANTYDLSI